MRRFTDVILGIVFAFGLSNCKTVEPVGSDLANVSGKMNLEICKRTAKHKEVRDALRASKALALLEGTVRLGVTSEFTNNMLKIKSESPPISFVDKFYALEGDNPVRAKPRQEIVAHVEQSVRNNGFGGFGVDALNEPGNLEAARQELREAVQQATRNPETAAAQLQGITDLSRILAIDLATGSKSKANLIEAAEVAKIGLEAAGELVRVTGKPLPESYRAIINESAVKFASLVNESATGAGANAQTAELARITAGRGLAHLVASEIAAGQQGTQTLGLLRTQLVQGNETGALVLVGEAGQVGHAIDVQTGTRNTEFSPNAEGVRYARVALQEGQGSGGLNAITRQFQFEGQADQVVRSLQLTRTIQENSGLSLRPGEVFVAAQARLKGMVSRLPPGMKTALENRERGAAELLGRTENRLIGYRMRAVPLPRAGR